MPDFNIDQIIAGGAGASSRADFSKLGDIPKAYYEGQDQAYKQKMRDVFSDENGGLPRDKDGNVDFQKAYERLVTVGGLRPLMRLDRWRRPVLPRIAFSLPRRQQRP
jgi:hypothetical protein